ncbi:MAG: ParB/RepB/Spo0J family partition protein [Kiritimatiellae bacterium]|nr:ParB/RepB/Spo0J family partition protein [Kiritimatiellia bacterium]
MTQSAKKPAKTGGLGRGLDALISREQTRGVAAVPPPPAPAAPAAAVSRAVSDVPVRLVTPSPWQPRQEFDPDALRELAESIKVHGIIQPLVCRKAAGGLFELVGGERRLRAAQLAGLDKVPVIVIDAVDRDAAELALVENLQREDLNAIEEAEGYKALADKFSLTQEEIADRVGKARPSVANALRLLDLPDEVKQLVGARLLSTGHAKVLLGVTGEKERVALAREALEAGLTVRALERLVERRRAAAAKPRRAPAPDIEPAALKDLLARLHARFGTRVRLVPSVTFANGRHGRGRVEIDFADNDELTRLLELFGIDVNEI